MKKGVIALALLLSLPTVLAQNMLGRIWDRIISWGNLSFLGIADSSVVAGFIRLLLAFLVFTIFYAVMVNASPLHFVKPNQAAVIAAILGIITAIFIPTAAILGIGSSWALVITFILIGGPIVGIFYILFNLTKWMGQSSDTKFTVFIKLLLCVLLFWIFSALKYHVGRMA